MPRSPTSRVFAGPPPALRQPNLSLRLPLRRGLRCQPACLFRLHCHGHLCCLGACYLAPSSCHLQVRGPPRDRCERTSCARPSRLPLCGRRSCSLPSSGAFSYVLHTCCTGCPWPAVQSWSATSQGPHPALLRCCWRRRCPASFLSSVLLLRSARCRVVGRVITHPYTHTLPPPST